MGPLGSALSLGAALLPSRLPEEVPSGPVPCALQLPAVSAHLSSLFWMDGWAKISGQSLPVLK